jgi:hypothetical protein
MREGQVYRRQDLAGFTSAIDRDLKTLLSRGVVKKLAPGLYMRPKKNRFGTSPPTDNDLVKAFLKTDDFLLTSYNNYNSLGMGLTQVYNQALVYNHKRNGKFQLGGRKFEFRTIPSYPSELSREYLLVDMLNNLRKLPDNTNAVEANLQAKLKEFNSSVLRNTTSRYGSAFTKRLIEKTHA